MHFSWRGISKNGLLSFIRYEKNISEEYPADFFDKKSVFENTSPDAISANSFHFFPFNEISLEYSTINK